MHNIHSFTAHFDVDNVGVQLAAVNPFPPIPLIEGDPYELY